MILITEKSLKKNFENLDCWGNGPWKRMLRCLGHVKRMGLWAWEGMRSDSGFANCLTSSGGLPYSAFYRVVGGLSDGPGKYKKHSVNAFCFIEFLCSLVLCLHVWSCLIPCTWSYRELWVTVWVLETDLASLEEQPVKRKKRNTKCKESHLFSPSEYILCSCLWPRGDLRT